MTPARRSRCARWPDVRAAGRPGPGDVARRHRKRLGVDHRGIAGEIAMPGAAAASMANGLASVPGWPAARSARTVRAGRFSQAGGPCSGERGSVGAAVALQQPGGSGRGAAPGPSSNGNLAVIGCAPCQPRCARPVRGAGLPSRRRPPRRSRTGPIMTRSAFTLVLLTAIRIALAGEAMAMTTATASGEAGTATTAAAGQAPATAWLVGRVTGSDGQPVLMAQVAIPGTDTFAYTDADATSRCRRPPAADPPHPGRGPRAAGVAGTGAARQRHPGRI